MDSTITTRKNGISVAVIPARGGSKRIPGKNIRSFLGSPAIAYPILAAKCSALFDRIVVSTDCPRIAEVALSAGAEVPFMRPAALADDHCGTGEVLAHAIAMLDQTQEVPIEFACCIYPTAVLVSKTHLIDAYQRLRAAPSTDYCFTVSAYHHPIQRALRRTETSTIVAIAPEHQPTRTQDLPPHYFDAGQFYWATASAVRRRVSLCGGSSLPYILRRTEFVDIDDLDDWTHAEAMAVALRNQAFPEHPRTGALTEHRRACAER